MSGQDHNGWGSPPHPDTKVHVVHQRPTLAAPLSGQQERRDDLAASRGITNGLLIVACFLLLLILLTQIRFG